MTYETQLRELAEKMARHEWSYYHDYPFDAQPEKTKQELIEGCYNSAKIGLDFAAEQAEAIYIELTGNDSVKGWFKEHLLTLGLVPAKTGK